MNEFLWILLVAAGSGLGFFVARSRSGKSEGAGGSPSEDWVRRSERDALQERYDQLEQRSVDKELFQGLQKKLDERQDELIKKEGLLKTAQSEQARLQEKLAQQEKQLISLEERFQKEFENLSNRILDEKSEKFIKMNEEKVGQLLNPLRDRLKSFEAKVEQNNKEQVAYGAALKQQIEDIVKTSKQMSEDTLRLTHALKGDKKLQGDWGEMQLEAILNAAGLQEKIHYEAQSSHDNQDGRKQRLDYLIRLPDDKHLILDAKVSLVDYDRTLDEGRSEDERKSALKAHTKAIEKHIDDLGSRNYQKVDGIHTPDYVLMFVPIEPALHLALSEEPRLFERALNKNVVLVSTSTLLATLRTVSYIWKQENQSRNVREIARESGALYDKFVGFTQDLLQVGKKMDDAKNEYAAAMNKLIDSPKKGGTVIGRMERLRELGAEATKKIPQNLLDRASE